MSKILVVYDSQDDSSISNVNSIMEILSSLSLPADLIPITEKLPLTLSKQDDAIVFNLITLLNNEYSWFLTATCDFLNIPYTGSGIFTISTFSTPYFKQILQYSDITIDDSYQKEVFEVHTLGNDPSLLFANGITTIESNTDGAGQFDALSDRVKKIKRNLRIYDYLTISLTSESENTVVSINPFPVLFAESPFIQAFNNLGLSYTNIIAIILYSTMKRYALPIPPQLEHIQSTCLKKVNYVEV